MKKKVVSLLLVFSVIFIVFCGSVMASAPVTKSEVLITYNGKDMDFTGIISQNRTLLPLRHIGEMMNNNVEWYPTTKKIVVSNPNQIVELWLDRKEAYVNNVRKDLDVAPICTNGVTMVPVRAICEWMGCTVDFGTKSVTVKKYGRLVGYNTWNAVSITTKEYNDKDNWSVEFVPANQGGNTDTVIGSDSRDVEWIDGAELQSKYGVEFKVSCEYQNHKFITNAGFYKNGKLIYDLPDYDENECMAKGGSVCNGIRIMRDYDLDGFTSPSERHFDINTLKDNGVI